MTMMMHLIHVQRLANTTHRGHILLLRGVTPRIHPTHPYLGLKHQIIQLVTRGRTTRFYPSLGLTQTDARPGQMVCPPTRQTLGQTQRRIKQHRMPQKNARHINKLPRKSRMGRMEQGCGPLKRRV
jgi:hypothetical protein